MARICELSGKKPFTGNNVSHSNRKTRARWLPNIKNKKYFIPETGQTLSLSLSTRAIRTIDKVGGITKAILSAKENTLSPRLLTIRSKITKSVTSQAKS